MQCTVWDSSAVKPASEFEYYHTGLCKAFAHLTPFKPEAGIQFAAKMEHWVSQTNEFTFLQTASHRVMRSKQDINLAEDDNYYLNYVQSGELWLEQDQQRAVLKRGDFAIIDNAKPFDVQINAQKGHRHLAFRINKEKLKTDNNGFMQRLKTHQLLPALAGAVSFLSRANAQWLPERISALAQSIENLALIIATEDALVYDNLQAQKALSQVRSHISHKYADPDLSITMAAISLGIPSRTLQKHLQICGTNFSTLLQNTRLAHAQHLLVNSHRCIEDICYNCGFQDLSTFYRAFKARYGIAPGATRNNA